MRDTGSAESTTRNRSKVYSKQTTIERIMKEKDMTEDAKDKAKLAVHHLHNLRSPNSRSQDSFGSPTQQRVQSSKSRSRLNGSRVRSGKGSAKAAYKDLIGMY